MKLLTFLQSLFSRNYARTQCDASIHGFCCVRQQGHNGKHFNDWYTVMHADKGDADKWIIPQGQPHMLIIQACYWIGNKKTYYPFGYYQLNPLPEGECNTPSDVYL